jgi:hypothetical protein
MNDFLGLEMGDILQLPGEIRFYITDLKKKISRGKSTKLELDGFKILTY